MRISDWSSDVCSSDLLVRVDARARSVDEIRNAAAATRGGVAITVGQIANVRIGGDLRTGAGSMNGEEAVIGTVLMLINENSRIVAQDVSAKLDQVSKTLRSEEHTSELQSLMRISYAVFCLKKKKKKTKRSTVTRTYQSKTTYHT